MKTKEDQNVLSCYSIIHFLSYILQLEEWYLNCTLGKVNKICPLLTKATTDHKVVKINKCHWTRVLLSPIFDISDLKRQSCPFTLHLFPNLHQDDTKKSNDTDFIQDQFLVLVSFPDTVPSAVAEGDDKAETYWREMAELLLSMVPVIWNTLNCSKNFCLTDSFLLVKRDQKKQYTE